MNKDNNQIVLNISGRDLKVFAFKFFALTGL
jgi:hypothetical protein